MYSYKKTKENTASAMNPKFENYSSLASVLSLSTSTPAAAPESIIVCRHRHISNKDHRFASIAMDEASKSTLLMQHGCIAVLSGKVIAKGCNNIRCHSKDGLLHYRKFF